MLEESFGIIPFKEGKVLLVQLHAGHWGFPKGHALKGEAPLAAAKRELEEETGLKVVRLLSDKPFQERYMKGMTPKRATYFAAEVAGEVKPQGEEIKDWGWFSVKNVHQRLTFAELKALWLNSKLTET